MPLYYFNLRSGGGEVLIDLEGTELPDEASAWEHARTVAREVLRNQEQKTHFWRLDVHDSSHCPRFNLLFSTVNQLRDHLRPDLRAALDRMSENTAALAAAVADARLTLQRARSTMARCRRELRLAATDGNRLTP
jgi:hypothetical protein